MAMNPNNKSNYPNFLGVSIRVGSMGFKIALLLIGVVVVALILRTETGSPAVVVYTSQDQEYAEPIFEKFKRETGIRVMPVYDNESAKTIGLVNRLIAEKSHPQCDVF